jgi:hypothetical protein
MPSIVVSALDFEMVGVALPPMTRPALLLRK